MKFSFKTFVLVLAAVALVGLTVGGVLLSGFEGGGIFDGKNRRAVEMEKTVPAAQVQRLDVGSIDAEIRIHEGEGDQIRFHLHGWTSSVNNPTDLTVRQDGDLVKVGVQRKYKFNISFFSTNLILDVYLPKMKFREANLHTVSGEITVDAMDTMDFRASTTSGDMMVQNLRAERSRFNTTSGDVKAAGILGNLDSHTVSGELRFNCDQFTNQTIKAGTVSGDVALDLPQGSSFTLNAHSVAGDIHCGFPIATDSNRDNKLAGTVGSGRGSVEIGTVSGDIRVE